MEIGNESIRHAEIIRGEDKLVRPPFKLRQPSFGGHAALQCTYHRRTHGTNFMLFILRVIHDFHRFRCHEDLFRIHLMLRQILHVHLPEIPQSDVQRDVSEINPLDLHTFHQLATKMHTRSRGSHRTFMLGKNSLVIISIFRFHFPVNKTRKRGFAQRVQLLLELVIFTIEQETQSSPARSGIINDLGHHTIIFPEIQLVPDTYFPSRINQHVPNTQFRVQLSQQKHLDLRTGFFLVSI